nr:MAG TPA: hypothetical protein [Caudoviricetes sp.]
MLLILVLSIFPISIGQVFMWTISYLDVSRSFRFGTCIIIRSLLYSFIHLDISNISKLYFR